MDSTLLYLQCAATFFMTGVIWVVQILVYPAFAQLAPESFAAHHDAHRRRITPIVGPPMLAELAVAALLVVFPPAGVDPRLGWLGLGLVAAIWASTLGWQIPLHEKLAAGFDAAAHAALVRSNWARTVAWTLRSALALYFLWAAAPN